MLRSTGVTLHVGGDDNTQGDEIASQPYGDDESIIPRTKSRHAGDGRALGMNKDAEKFQQSLHQSLDTDNCRCSIEQVVEVTACTEAAQQSQWSILLEHLDKRHWLMYKRWHRLPELIIVFMVRPLFNRETAQ